MGNIKARIIKEIEDTDWRHLGNISPQQWVNSQLNVKLFSRQQPQRYQPLRW